MDVSVLGDAGMPVEIDKHMVVAAAGSDEAAAAAVTRTAPCKSWRVARRAQRTASHRGAIAGLVATAGR